MSRTELLKMLQESAVELEEQMRELMEMVKDGKVLTKERQATLIKASWADAVCLKEGLKTILSEDAASMKPAPTTVGREL